VKCPHCKSEIKREGVKFCPNCGGALSFEIDPPVEKKEGDTMKICPDCGTAIRIPEQNFCVSCGQNLLDAAVAVQEELAPEPVKECSAQQAEVSCAGDVTEGYSSSRKTSVVFLLLLILAIASGLVYGYSQGYILDTEPPQVAIVSLADGETITLSPITKAPFEKTVEVRARDNRKVRKIALYLNGTLVKEVTRGNSLYYRWAIGRKGIYTFEVYAYDRMNNKSSAETTVSVVSNIPPVKVTVKKLTKEKELLNIDLKVPIISGLQDKELEKRINDAIEKSFSEQINYIESMASNEDTVNMHSEGFLSELVLVGDYNVYYNHNGLISIGIKYYKYLGGVHGNSELHMINVDLKNGRELLIKDFYKDEEDWEEIVKGAIYEQMLSNPDKYFSETIQEWKARPLSPNQPFYISEDNSIVVCFGEYELGPYVIGMPEFEVPITKKLTEVKASGRNY